MALPLIGRPSSPGLNSSCAARAPKRAADSEAKRSLTRSFMRQRRGPKAPPNRPLPGSSASSGVKRTASRRPAAGPDGLPLTPSSAPLILRLGGGCAPTPPPERGPRARFLSLRLSLQRPEAFRPAIGPAAGPPLQGFPAATSGFAGPGPDPTPRPPMHKCDGSSGGRVRPRQLAGGADERRGGVRRPGGSANETSECGRSRALRPAERDPGHDGRPRRRGRSRRAVADG